MSADPPVSTAHSGDDADLAKAFQDLAKGERTATALENQLNRMEAKIDALLAQAEREQQDVQGGKVPNPKPDEGVTEERTT